MLTQLHRRWKSFARRFGKARGGMAAIEFALIAPVMLLLYFGVTEFSDAYTANTRVTLMASTAADLTAQEQIITNAQMTNIFNAVTAIMYPYTTTGMDIVVTSLVDAGNSQVKVAWSSTQGGTARTVDSVVVIPTGLVTSGGGGSVILAEVSYNYSSPAGHLITGAITMHDKFYLKPRQVAKITRTN